MADDDIDIDALQKRMDGALNAMKSEFSSLRTGRASASILDPITVDAYGSQMPLNQCGTVNVPEPRMLSVQVWDASNVKAVEKAIRDSGLGLNPMPEGNTIRIPLPDLTEERRADLKKVAGKYAEAARVAVRNIRKDGMDSIKNGDGTEDDQKRQSDEVQKLTDDYVSKIDKILSDKESDIMTV